MSEMMIKFDDLRRYCENHHCGSVPLEYIKQMRTVEAEPVRHWIPCSERLPEIKKDHESDCVLCYCDTGAYAFSTLQENFLGQIGFACEKEDDYYHSIGKVIAWMPLPEPPEVTQE